MTYRSLCPLAFLLLPACGLFSSDGTTGGACESSFPSWPDAGTPMTAGCYADGTTQICQQGGSCSDLCSDGEETVTCTSGSEMSGTIPAPPESAGCMIVTIPTPSNALFYCCPCGT